MHHRRLDLNGVLASGLGKHLSTARAVSGNGVGAGGVDLESMRRDRRETKGKEASPGGQDAAGRVQRAGPLHCFEPGRRLFAKSRQ